MIWALLLAATGPSPAYVSPTALWGELKPSDVTTVAPARDHSGFDDTTTAYSAAKLTIAVEGWGTTTLLEAENTGFGVWDLAANPKNPPKLGGFTTPGFPKAPTGAAGNVFVADLASPPGTSTLAVLALDHGAGVALVSVANKALPVVLYQDGDPADGNTKTCRDAYAATFAGKPYALAACVGGPGLSGVAVYDLTAAAAIPAQYQEVAPNAGSQHPGVFVAHGALVRPWMDMGTMKSKAVTRIDGVEQFVVTNASTGGGFDLWDLSTVAAPKHLATGPVAFVGPVVMWKHTDRYFVAALSSTALDIFEVTKVVKGTSTDVGAPLSTYPPMRAYEAETRLLLSKAADGSVVLSYASGREPPHDTSAVGATEELLFDATDPTDPRIITPAAALVNGVQTTYFGYSHQFGWVRPLGSRFVGFFLYRAAAGVLEVHQWSPPLNRSPVISSSPVLTAVINRAYDYPIVASDPEGKAVKYTFVTAPAGMAFLSPGEVSWVPTAADLGPAAVTVNVSDGRNNVPHSWTITVTDGLDAGMTADAGTTTDGGTGPMKTGGCGCGQTENNSPLWLALFLAFGYLRRHDTQDAKRS